jgi:hypothetical protein
MTIPTVESIDREVSDLWGRIDDLYDRGHLDGEVLSQRVRNYKAQIDVLEEQRKALVAG